MFQFNKALKVNVKLLEAQVERLTAKVAHLSETNKTLMSTIHRKDALIEGLKKELAPTPYLVTALRLTQVKFNALFNGVYQPTKFVTGPGPCGKTVKWFSVKETDRHLVITQHHDDGTHKEFLYRLSDIDGRIQKDFENVVLNGKDADDEIKFRKLVNFGVPKVV